MSAAEWLASALAVERRMDLALMDRRRDAPVPIVRAVRARQMAADRPLFRVAAAQRELELTAEVEDYLRRIESLVASAKAQDCHLIAFPEYNMIDLAGTIPFLRGISRRMRGAAEGVGSGAPSAGWSNRSTRRRNSRNKAARRRRTRATPAGLSARSMSALGALSSPLTRAMFRACRELAARYHIAIYTGTGLLAREGVGLQNVGRLYDWQGRLILEQAKLHLMPQEVAMGMAPGRELTAASLQYPAANGNVGSVTLCAPVCMDASYFETFHVARRLAADVAIVPIANDEPYQIHASLRGIWPRVQTAGMFGVRPALSGAAFGMDFTGCGLVCAPAGIAPLGVLSYSGMPRGRALAIADLDIAQLEAFRDGHAVLGDVNPAFARSMQSRYEAMLER